jgi:hypothetical protein
MKLKFDRIVVSALAFNALFWLYFWISFALAAEPYDPHPQGAHFPTNPLTVWGYSIGLVERLSDHVSWILVMIVQFPSLVAATLFRHVGFVIAKHTFDPSSPAPFPFTQGWTLAGIDTLGWVVITTMLISFLQWYLIGRLVSWAWRRFRKA